MDIKKRPIEKRIILALDFDRLETGINWISRMKDRISTFKIGPVMFLETGFAGLKDIPQDGIDFFIDLKFHDIPNTVSSTVTHLVNNNVSMFTVHALGGFDMMKSVAVQVGEYRAGSDTPLVLAVTVLTSHDGNSLSEIGIGTGVRDEVLRLASVAEKAGIDGLVCSGLEVEFLREEFGDRFTLVVPGVRMNGDIQDQKRVVTPGEAFDRGADFIVIGRSVTKSENPEETVDNIVKSIAN